MQDYLGAVGLLFFMFFVAAAATEAILEAFRGILERFGVTWLKADKSLDDAVKESTEFLPAGSEARGKVAALQDVVKNIKAVTKEKKDAIQALRTKFDALAPDTKIEDTVMAEVNSLAMHIKDTMDNSERTRIFWLRLISAGIAIVLSYNADIDALRSMIQAYPGLFKGTFTFYKVEGVGTALTVTPLGWAGANLGFILTGIAAASGSSYWHDQLDKVRNLKGVQEQLKKLAS